MAILRSLCRGRRTLLPCNTLRSIQERVFVNNGGEKGDSWLREGERKERLIKRFHLSLVLHVVDPKYDDLTISWEEERGISVPDTLNDEDRVPPKVGGGVDKKKKRHGIPLPPLYSAYCRRVIPRRGGPVAVAAGAGEEREVRPLPLVHCQASPSPPRFAEPAPQNWPLNYPASIIPPLYSENPRSLLLHGSGMDYACVCLLGFSPFSLFLFAFGRRREGSVGVGREGERRLWFVFLFPPSPPSDRQRYSIRLDGIFRPSSLLLPSPFAVFFPLLPSTSHGRHRLA